MFQWAFINKKKSKKNKKKVLDLYFVNFDLVCKW